ncbi:hypothetical protein BDP27DRAFT_1419895 [Rhodocollybia butyracea]|uniref:Uncharacterized protein n=1 Tax=Rhodocollybia butyracea TaxID=206335 RepID=A0A9P5PYD9_9AGAR|nr:hypothetical protein BDP27DRAFT_1419895 [Rhodocollybia butyracea]
MEHYLNQSRDASLTLFITAGNLDQSFDETGHNSDEFVESNLDYLKLHSWDALNILFLSSRRWKDVTINLSWAVFIEMPYCIDLNDHRFDQLECLILDWHGQGEDGGEDGDNFVSLFTSKAQSPRLRSLSLSEYEPQGNLPFCHITTLGPMRGWSTSGMIDVLTNCHNVDSFTIILDKGHGTGIALQPLLIKARSLDIEGYFSSHQFQWIELLNSLIATQLENLTLRRLAGDHWQPSLLDFISRSRCPLQTLTLCDDIYIDQYLLQLLSLVSTLISLTMKVYAIDDDLFNGLVATAESSIIPRLQQFDLVYSYYGQTENGHLDNTVLCILAMAESQLQSSSSVGFLEQFSVKYDVLASSSWDLNSESLLRLRRLNEAGMKASITVVRTLT